MNFESISWQQVLLLRINDPESKRLDVAKSYRSAMQSSERGDIDWGHVNRAITERWSPAGLIWIKRMAWSGKAFK